MTAYTADDFKTARFATHPDGRIAMRRDPGKHNAWFTSNGSIPSDIDMAHGGWVPVRECPDPEVHEGRGDDDRTIPWKTAALNWEYRAEKAEKERDELRAAAVELAPATPDPRPLTAREHLEAAWEAAHVPEGNIPEGADYITRWDDGRMAYRRAESPYLAPWEVDIYGDRSERRLLDPPVPSRPEWADLADVLGDFAIADEHSGDRDDMILARRLHERGVRVTGAES